MTTINYPIHDDAPRPGFYKMKRRDGGWSPVAIWYHDDELVCRVGKAMADPSQTWLYCAKYPVSKKDANFAFENGGKWPNETPAPIGDNAPPSDDPFENLTREIEAEELRVKAWVAEPHEGASKAEMASNWLASLRKLESKTVAAFETEKAPALAETQRIDKKWRDLKARAAAIKKLMDDAYQVIGRKEKARLQAIADKKAKEEAEAKRQAFEAEQARKAALAAEHNIPVEQVPMPLFDAPAAPVKVAFGGAQGAKIAVRKIPPQAVVEDWVKCAAHYANHAKVQEVIQKLASHDAKDGRLDIPGVRIIPGEG